jgi:predicted AAA+ superfamily ATPase
LFPTWANVIPLSDALNRLADQLHYLNSSGDKAQDATRYWFDTRANLRREMEERKKRFDDNEVRGRMAEVVKSLNSGAGLFDGTHIFTPNADVPDDAALRLVVLPPEQFYSREKPNLAFDAALSHVRSHGTAPRYRGNRLIFLAPDHGALTRFRDCIRVALAWNSIVEDVSAMRLVLDNLQAQQAKKELQAATTYCRALHARATSGCSVPHKTIPWRRSRRWRCFRSIHLEGR